MGLQLLAGFVVWTTHVVKLDGSSDDLDLLSLFLDFNVLM